MAAAVEVAQPLVYSPRTLSETLAFLSANPGCQIIAGGTARNPEVAVAVSLHQLDELKRITLGERALDLGAGVTLAALLALPDSQVPRVLKEALRSIGTSALRNLATLGGNVCQRGFFGDLVPVLLLLGAQFELRGQRTSRWVAAQDFGEHGHVELSGGEVLVRVRLPLEDPGVHFYQKIGSFRSAWDERLSMVCLATPKNGLISRFRLVFSLPQSGLVRHRDLEADLTGQRLPLSARERATVLERLDEYLGHLPLPASVFQRERILHLARWVLTRLEDD
ncbi:MAG: FAD binding domain-containing protein [Spirochaetales bacterium]